MDADILENLDYGMYLRFVSWFTKISLWLSERFSNINTIQKFAQSLLIVAQKNLFSDETRSILYTIGGPNGGVWIPYPARKSCLFPHPAVVSGPIPHPE